MAGSADAIIQTLLQGTGYGHTPGDFQQQADQHALAQQSVQHNNFALQGDQQAQQDAQQYSRDVGAWIAAGSPPEALPTLAVKYPKQYEAIKAGWDLKDKAQQTADLNFFGQAYAAANNGRTDLAKAQLVARRDAEKEAGVDTKELDDLIGQFDTDPKGAAADLKSVALAHIYAGDKDGFAKAFGIGPDKGYTLSGDDVRFDSNNNVVARGPGKKQEPFHYTLKDANGVEHEFMYDPGSGQPLPPGAVPSSGGKATVSPGAVQNGKLEPQVFYKDFVLPHEGGYAAHDANGAPVNHGINQSANPGVDVKNLTEDQAADIFANKYFAASGAANLPPALAAVHADTSFINPKRADQFLQQAGGDVNKYMTMRQSWMNSLVKNQPDKYGKYAKAWNSRNADLSAYAAQLDGGSSQGGASVGGSGQMLGARQLDSTPFASQANGGQIPGDATLSGDAYVASLPPNMAATVKLLTGGQMAFPSSFALGKPYWQNILAAAQHADPTLDSSTQPMRVQARKQFTGNGKAAQVASSGNRLAYHLNDLYRDSQALSGPNLGWTPLSNLVAGSAQSFQGPAVARYKAVLPFISGELQKLTKNGTATEGETKLIMQNLAPGQSTEARNAAIQQIVELAEGQFRPFRDQWASAFGPDKPPPVDFTPTTLKIFDHITNGKDPLTVDANGTVVGSNGHGTSASAPAQAVHVATMAQALKLAPGTHFIDPHGQERVRP